MPIIGRSERIAVIATGAEVPSEHKAYADKLVALRHGEIGSGPYGILVHSPDLACRVAEAAEYIRFGSSLPKSTIELATLAATRELDAEYPWTVHQPGAHDAGVSERAIATLRDGSSTDGLPDDEKLVIDYVRTIQRDHRISTECFAALQERFGVQGVVDLAATVGMYALLGCVVNTFELKPTEV